MVRFAVTLIFILVLGLLLLGVVIPSKRDTTAAAWWARVRRDVETLFRVLIALACLTVIGWYVVWPLLGWR